jgi:hypothetical protein
MDLIPTQILELYYLIMNKPYFKVFILSNGRKVKSFIQLAIANEFPEGLADFLICKSIKSAWWKPNNPIIDGVKFVVYVKTNNAIPLKFVTQKTYEENGEYLINEYITETISEDTDKPHKDGAPETLAEIAYPPTVLFQELEAVFVTETLTPPPSKVEEMGKYLPWILIAGAIIIFMVINKGKLPFIG